MATVNVFELCDHCDGLGTCGPEGCPYCHNCGGYMLPLPALVCTIPGNPVPYQRTTSYTDSRGRRRRHNPERYQRWRYSATMLLEATRRRAGEEPWAGPLGVRIEVVYSRLKLQEGTDGRARRPTASGDLDNVVKAVLDAAVDAGWFPDDDHVQRIEAERWHAAEGEDPGVTLTMWRVEP